MVELLFFPQSWDLANLPSVKLTLLDCWKQMSPCKHQNMHSRDLQSPYGLLALEKEKVLQTCHSMLSQHLLTSLVGCYSRLDFLVNYSRK